MKERHVTKEDVDGLVQKLELPELDSYSQDWEIEVASASLATPLISAYETRRDLTEGERFTLMIVILESLNECLDSGQDVHANVRTLRRLLLRDFPLHECTLDDYASWHCSLTDAFAVASLVRSIIKEVDCGRLPGNEA